MLIARAPLRISFAGGGTDLEVFFAKFGGAVVSATINKYFYVFLSRTIDDAIQISSSDYRAFERRAAGEELSREGDLGYLKGILREFGVNRGLSLFTACEIPPGSGLGSSSSVAVALVKALTTLVHHRASKQEIAELAAYLEIVKLGCAVGVQDQFAAAYGGLNWIEFRADGVTVTPLRLPLAVRDRLERSILLFYTGFSRSAPKILSEQSRLIAAGDPRVLAGLQGIRRDAEELREALEQARLHRLGEILHTSWQRKKELVQGVSNERLDYLYQLALEHGATGGKVAGAGGGGFLLLYCETEYQADVTRALEREGLARLTFHFDDGGAQVLVNSIPDVPGLHYPAGPWMLTGVASA